MAKPKFLVVEGIDGSGITTQVEALRTWCETHQKPVFITKEPSDGPAGGLLKVALTKRIKLSPDVIALLFTADRLDHLEHDILPRLEEGLNVISDRYYLSTYAYQTEDVDLQWLRTINAKCLKPDLTIFLDVPVEASMSRWSSDVLRSYDRLQLYEEESILRRVRDRYLSMIELLRGEGEIIEIVDGTGDKDAVLSRLVALVGPVLDADASDPITIRRRNV